MLTKRILAGQSISKNTEPFITCYLIFLFSPKIFVMIFQELKQLIFFPRNRFGYHKKSLFLGRQDSDHFMVA